MKQILKRLELIQTSIEIDDEEIIELQINKLKKIEIDNEVQKIIAKLENLDYSSVISDIEAYLKRYSGLSIYIDSEVQGLKLELKALEKKLQYLSEIKNEYLNDIEEFNTLYNLRLGNIIEKILELRGQILEEVILKKQEAFIRENGYYEEIKYDFLKLNSDKRKIEDELAKFDEFDDEYDSLFKEYQEIKEEFEVKEEELHIQREKTKEAKNNLEDDPIYEEYQDIKNDYNEFHYDYKEVKEKEEQRYHLNEAEKKELKKNYREASRICHPDIVADELKFQATEIMKQLNEAYDSKDIKKVKEILSNLKNGTSFEVVSDKTDSKKVLKSKIQELREKNVILENELDEIQEDEAFQIIQEIENMDIYFNELENQLKEEYKKLEEEKSELYQNIEEEIDDIETLIDAHKYFEELQEEIDRGYEEIINNENIKKEKFYDY